MAKSPRLVLLLAAVSMLFLLTSSSSISFADNPNYMPCNYFVTIDYYTNPTTNGNINGYTNGGTETFNYNNVPCSENYFSYEMFAHPEKQAFSIWSVSGGTLSSPVDNGTTLTVRADGTAHVTANFVMGLLVPLYIYPTTEDPNTGVTYWQDLINAKNSYPNVPVIAVANPASGPGDSANSDYTNGMKSLANAGIIILGYVYTHYGDRPIGSSTTYNSVEQAISNWTTFYPNLLSGIFFDEMNYPDSNHNNGGPSYYSTITSFAHNDGLKIVVGNPGSPTNSSYVGTVDIITPYEGGVCSGGCNYLPSASTISSITVNGQGFPTTVSSQWGIFAYNISSTLLTQKYVNSNVEYIGWIYVTDEAGESIHTAGFPYNVLPTYLKIEVSYLSIS